MEAGTHFKNTFGRDIGQFRLAQGATTMVYPLRYSEEERRSDQAKLAISPRGLRRFSRPAALRLRRSSYGYSFLAAPCGYKKISRNAT